MPSPHEIGVAYIARGADAGWNESMRAFRDSYCRHQAGIDHDFYVIYKGFEDDADLARARQIFAGIANVPLYLEDQGFDIGAYIQCARVIRNEILCAFGSASSICSDDWLQKLHANFMLPGVGLVGATGSYESLETMSPNFPPFPSVHVRSNAFMIRRGLFCSITDGVVLADKIAAYHFENGRSSMTRQVLAAGHRILVVGANGRGYAPKFWPVSDTFRQGTQANLLVADNQTRNFGALAWADKQSFALKTWGRYIDDLELCDC